MSALRTLTVIAASALLVLVTTGASSTGVRPGTAEGAELVKTGWWWAGNETPLDETVAAPPQSSPPTVPKGALPVAATGGEPDKVSALEFDLAGKPGSFVEHAVLVLRESSEPGAVLNPEGARILACPVTESFWADGTAAAWKARPAYDCDLAGAAGQRDAKTGLWTFDLTSVAALWAAQGSTGSTSVALVEAVDAPESFQVAFDGPRADGVGFAFAFAAPPRPTASGPTAGTGALAPVSTGGSSGASFGGGSAGAPAPVAGTSDTAPVAAAPPAPQEQAVAAPASVATAPVAAPLAAPAWYSGIPVVGYLLLPLTLGLAYLLMLALGPDAQPASGPAQHGVARALERMRALAASRTAKEQG